MGRGLVGGLRGQGFCCGCRRTVPRGKRLGEGRERDSTSEVVDVGFWFRRVRFVSEAQEKAKQRRIILTHTRAKTWLLF